MGDLPNTMNAAQHKSTEVRYPLLLVLARDGASARCSEAVVLGGAVEVVGLVEL